jgi:mRNA deadenylase 3'-5' endonuclease subunit Ccr4
LKPDFDEILDYIFYEKEKAEVDNILTYDESIFKIENKALPNSFHPSDHIPVRTEFIFKTP